MEVPWTGYSFFGWTDEEPENTGNEDKREPEELVCEPREEDLSAIFGDMEQDSEDEHDQILSADEVLGVFAPGRVEERSMTAEQAMDQQDVASGGVTGTPAPEITASEGDWNFEEIQNFAESRVPNPECFEILEKWKERMCQRIELRCGERDDRQKESDMKRLDAIGRGILEEAGVHENEAESELGPTTMKTCGSCGIATSGGRCDLCGAPLCRSCYRPRRGRRCPRCPEPDPEEEMWHDCQENEELKEDDDSDEDPEDAGFEDADEELAEDCAECDAEQRDTLAVLRIETVRRHHFAHVRAACVAKRALRADARGCLARAVRGLGSSTRLTH